MPSVEQFSGGGQFDLAAKSAHAAALPSVEAIAGALVGDSESVPSVLAYLGLPGSSIDDESESEAFESSQVASLQTTLSLRTSLKVRTSKFADEHGWSGADAVLAAVSWAEPMLAELVIREREGARHPALKNTRFNLERSTRKRKTVDPKTKFSLYASTEQIDQLDTMVAKATSHLVRVLSRPKTNRSEVASAVLPVFMDMIEEQERLEAEARKAAREARQTSSARSQKAESSAS